MASSGAEVLKITGLTAGYGPLRVLHEIDFKVAEGERVGLVGLNGHGKTTLFRAISSLVGWQSGSILLHGKEIGGSRSTGPGRKTPAIVRAGLAMTPQGDAIFPGLTVHQNLLLGQKGKGTGSRWSFDDMYAMFPRLKERQHTEAGVLSGGEQQMLTLCRTLMGDPDLIIIDEPTEGLAPKIVELVAEYLQRLKARGISVLLIEQKLTIAMSISDRALVMGHGSIVFEGTPEDLRNDPVTRKEWLEV